MFTNQSFKEITHNQGRKDQLVVVGFACMVVCFPSRKKLIMAPNLGHFPEVNLPVHKDTGTQYYFLSLSSITFLLLPSFASAWAQTE